MTVLAMDRAPSSQIVQLNDSLFQLWMPRGSPSMQVVFFHGLQPANEYHDAHVRTWSNFDGSCIWPATWLVERFPQAHILSVSYNAGWTKYGLRGKYNRDSGRVDMYLIAENLVSDLVEAKIGQLSGCPVILVGHSFGGLMIKKLCVHASLVKGDLLTNTRHSKFLENVKGIFFYSTPHQGTPLADVMGDNFVPISTISEFVKILSTPRARLNFHFENLCRKFKTWRIEGVGETLQTKLGTRRYVLVVPEAAARYGSSFNLVTGADHFSICKPKNRVSRSFYALTNLLGNIALSSKIQLANHSSILKPKTDTRRARPSSLEDTATNSKDTVCPENLQHLPKSIIGIDHVLKDIKIKLDKANGLGLVGMGGIGKTTLAKKLFNDLGPRFEYTCFLKDVKQIQGSLKAEAVKETFLKNLHRWGKPVREKRGGLASLRGEKVLLILDDVASEEDFEIVSTLIEDFAVHKDSRFVATSRDAALLKLYLDKVHLVPFLGQKHSKELFLSFAFRSEVNPSGNKYVDAIVKKCGKLPLTLEVIGKYLYGKAELIWTQAEEMLDKAMTVADIEKRLWSKWKVSYNGLNKVEQDLFLDAATSFYNYDLAYAKRLWKVTTEGSQDMAWQYLVDLSLVWESKDDEGTTRINMHEQLRSLGRKIASTPEENSLRFWDEDGERKAWELLSTENCNVDNVKDIVALRLGISSIPNSYRGYSYKGKHTPMQKCIQRSTLCKMTKLRYLVLGDVDLDQNFGEALPSTLVELLWFSRNLTDLPFDPSLHEKLCILCLDFKKLRTLPTTFGQLSSLRKLEINCENLKRLPDSLGNLAMLETLKLSSCLTLEELPTTVGKLVALEELFLLFCGALSKLPSSIGYLPMLTKLHISGCDSLVELPDTLNCLVRLEEFWLQNCIALTVLPNSLGRLTMLKKMAIIGCSSISKLPGTLDGLVNLEDMCLQSCYALSDLSNSFGLMPMLKKLEIIYCDRLQEQHLTKILSNLVALEYLILRKGNVRSSFPDTLSSLPALLKFQPRTAPTPPGLIGRGQNYGQLHSRSWDFYDKAKVRWNEDRVQKELLERWMGGVCLKKDELWKTVEKEFLKEEGELFYMPQEERLWEEAENRRMKGLVQEELSGRRVGEVCCKRVDKLWKKVDNELLEEEEQLFYEAEDKELLWDEEEENLGELLRRELF